MARQKRSLKFQIGDLAIYTNPREIDPQHVDQFAPYWLIRLRYPRPFFMEEANNIGIIMEVHHSSLMFLRTNKKNNVYIWCSQQTGKEYLMFEEELTNGEDYAKMTSYGSSFLTDRFNKK
jgi:hypothetical protein